MNGPPTGNSNNPFMSINRNLSIASGSTILEAFNDDDRTARLGSDN